MSSHTLSRPGRFYVSAVILTGSCTVGASAYAVVVSDVGLSWLILAALTIVSGSATVKLPSIPASLSVSETFVFTSVLFFGPEVGTLIVALDGLIISLWLNRGRKELYRLLFNMCAPAVSVWLAAHLFFALAGVKPVDIRGGELSIDTAIGPLIAFTVAYFLLNSWLIAFAVSFETSQPAALVWRTNFVWLSLNFFCGASVAAFFLTVFPDKNHGLTAFIAYLGAILPLLLVLYLTYRTSMARVEDANKHLSQMNQMYLATIETLALAIDAKDQVTHGHIRRVQSFAVTLTRALGGGDSGLMHAMEAASLLHDMGKLAVPEHILNKPGKLTTAEFDRMKLHASIGADILSSIRFPYPVIPIVRHHHESWDGSGYPDGLSGTSIPLGARILSVVDCYDALTSDRPYRPRLTPDQAIAILVQRRGSMYDPLIVDTFVHMLLETGGEEQLNPVDGNPALLELARQIAQNSQFTTADRPTPAVVHRTSTFVDLCFTVASANRHTSVASAMAFLAPHLRHALPSDMIVLFLYDSLTDELAVEFSTGRCGAELRGFRVRLGQNLAGWVGARMESALNSSPGLDFNADDFPTCSLLQSCLMVPLILDESLLGTLGFYSIEAARYTREDQQLAELVATQVAGVISRMRMERRVGQPAPSYRTPSLKFG